jgi:hypothetical protein
MAGGTTFDRIARRWRIVRVDRSQLRVLRRGINRIRTRTKRMGSRTRIGGPPSDGRTRGFAGSMHLYAHCHAQHAASIRVLKKCGFEFDALLEKHSVFPNLEDATPQDVHRYVHPLRNSPASVA